MSAERPRGLYTTLLTAERDDLNRELGVGRQHPVIAVTVNAWRSNEQSEPFEELQGSERERCRPLRGHFDALWDRRTEVAAQLN